MISEYLNYFRSQLGALVSDPLAVRGVDQPIIARHDSRCRPATGGRRINGASGIGEQVLGGNPVPWIS